jgi:GDP-D-mannose dehydratase
LCLLHHRTTIGQMTLLCLIGGPGLVSIVSKVLIIGITGQDGAYLARLLLAKGYAVHGTSRDAAMARLCGLRSLGVRDKVTLHSMSPVDFRSVAQVIERVEPAEIYNLSGVSSVALSREHHQHHIGHQPSGRKCGQIDMECRP